MTDVSFVKYRDTYIFQCSGHTGYAAAGEDILCSAVSVLCYTLREYLAGTELDSRLAKFRHTFVPGEVVIEFRAAHEEDTALIEAVRAILGGFEILAESFGEYIRTDIQF